MESPNEVTILVSEDYYTYLSTLIVDQVDDDAVNMFHVHTDGYIMAVETKKRIVPSPDSTYELGAYSNRWFLVKRLRAGGMSIEAAVNLAIRMYNTIPDNVILTHQAVDDLCAHYMGGGDHRLIFVVNGDGELTMEAPVSQNGN
jgi:hypothetical protein